MRRRTMLKKCFRSDVRRSRVCERNKLSCSCEPNTLPFRETSPANRRLATDTWNRLFATRTSLSIYLSSSVLCSSYFSSFYHCICCLSRFVPLLRGFYTLFLFTLLSFSLFLSSLNSCLSFLYLFCICFLPFHICTYINDILNSFPLLLLFGFLSL